MNKFLSGNLVKWLLAKFDLSLVKNSSLKRVDVNDYTDEDIEQVFNIPARTGSSPFATTFEVARFTNSRTLFFIVGVRGSRAATNTENQLILKCLELYRSSK